MIRDSSNYQSLPPLKRFTLHHHRNPSLDDDDDDDKENLDPSPPSFPLPAKKRKESRSPLVESPLYATLPTKKRVWAPPPDFSPQLLLNSNSNSNSNPRVDKDDGTVLLTLPDAAVDQPHAFPRDGRNDPLPVPDSKSQEEGMVVQEAAGTDKAERNPEEGEDEEDGILCVICQSTDGDPADPIVFCDGCNLMAHATCYGNPLIRGIPDGEWYCHRCLASSEDGPAIACCLCPKTGGAMKPTVDGRWAHLVCAVFVPEVFFEDAEGREGINCGRIEGSKSCGKRCYICGTKRGGGLVECSQSRCKRGFHVTCGLEEDLWLDYKEGRGKAIVAGFCGEHTELWKKQQLTGKFKIVARED